MALAGSPFCSYRGCSVQTVKGETSRKIFGTVFWILLDCFIGYSSNAPLKHFSTEASRGQRWVKLLHEIFLLGFVCLIDALLLHLCVCVCVLRSFYEMTAFSKVLVRVASFWRGTNCIPSQVCKSNTNTNPPLCSGHQSNRDAVSGFALFLFFLHLVSR